MTLGNIRTNGVRTLAAWCLGRSRVQIQDSTFLRRAVETPPERYYIVAWSIGPRRLTTL